MNTEKYEKLSQEMYGMSLNEYVLLNRHLDKRARYVALKFISLGRLINKECEGLKPQEEELLLAKIHAHTLNKAQKLQEKRHGNRKYLGEK